MFWEFSWTKSRNLGAVSKTFLKILNQNRSRLPRIMTERTRSENPAGSYPIVGNSVKTLALFLGLVPNKVHHKLKSHQRGDRKRFFVVQSQILASVVQYSVPKKICFCLQT